MQRSSSSCSGLLWVQPFLGLAVFFELQRSSGFPGLLWVWKGFTGLERQPRVWKGSRESVKGKWIRSVCKGFGLQRVRAALSV